MQRTITLIFTLFTYFSINAAVSKAVNLSIAGTLSTILTTTEKNTITDLTVTGNINAQDFKTMKQSMSALLKIDISGTSIIAYTGTGGTGGSASIAYPANEVPLSAFSYNTKITSVILPGTATSIASYAFYFSTALSQVTIPNTATTIGSYAFNNCNSLLALNIPASVISIGSLAVRDCTASITVDSGNSVYASLNGILYNKAKTTLIQCPTSVSGAITLASTTTTLDPGSFNYCVNLTQITIPASVTTIGNSAFRGCTALLVVEAGNTYFSSLNGILYNATKTILLQCPTSLSGTITIPSSVTTIETQSFYDCKLITKVIIPTSVTTINSGAFNYCSALTSATLPSALTILGASAFSNCTNLTQAIIPPTVTVINSNVFYNCTSLTQLTIPSSVTTIGNQAFYNCSSLTQVSLPASITSIGNQTFYNCTTLSTIYAYWSTPISITSGVFTNVNKTTCTLYVPTGATAAYDAAPYWTDFINMVEFNATPVETSDKTEFSIYPNPASSYFTVTTNQPAELVIIALSGVEVHKQFVYDKDRVDISHIKQGIYLINLNNHCIKLVKRL